MAPTPWAQLAPLRGPRGTTALAGQVLRVDGHPLRGVIVGIKGAARTVRTDASGRFLLAGGIPHGRHVLIVEGQDVGSHDYGSYRMRVDLAKGRTTSLDYTVWLTPLDRDGDTRVPVPTSKETVLTNARIPGLEVHIPKGTTITGSDGKAVRRLNLTALPVDRPPFPLPEGVDVPAYFTVQPGGAYLSKGASIVYPNYHHLPPGQRVTFWNYDAEDRGWYIYGHGEVTEDGKQVIPDPDVRVWEFTGAMASTGPGAPGSGPSAGGGEAGGDPVDLGTGLFVYRKSDLVVSDVLSAGVQRTYRPSDGNSYTFGRGTTSAYDLRLVNVSSYTAAELVLPDGGTVAFQRTSAGTGYMDAVYEARTTPGPWFGAVIRRTVDASGWDLFLPDGTNYEFDSGFGPVTAVRDRFGNELRITRDRGNYGMPVQVTTPSGRWLRFSYDEYNRATEVRDSAGRRLTYTYDADSRLATAVDADGGTTTYHYDTSGRMSSIEDARGHTLVSNTYDPLGRVIEQSLANGGVYAFAYTTGSNGKITKTRVTDPRQVKQDVTFDAAGLPSGKVYAAGDAAEQVMTYERYPTTNYIKSITDDLGRRTAYTYDGDGNVTSVTRLDGTDHAVTTSYTYASERRLTRVIDPLGHTKTYGYDSHGRLTSVTDETSRETTLGYDGADALPEWMQAANGKRVSFTWSEGAVRTIRDPLGKVTRRWTDSAGRIAAVTYPSGRTKRFGYTDGDRLAKITEPDGGTTALQYDPNGNLVHVTDARGKSTHATYDAMNLVDSWTDGAGASEHIVRDANGNIVKTTDRRDQVTTFRYDSLNRRTFTGYGTTGSPGSESYASTISYEYDGVGRVTKLEDSTGGTVTNVFDGLDRLTAQTTAAGTVTYAHDDANRRVATNVEGLLSTAYGYDAAGRTTSATQGSAEAAIDYDAAGRPEAVTLPNGIRRQMTYDDAGRVTALRYVRGTATVGDLHYAYDDDGRRTATWGSLARLRLPAAMAAATYDDANRRTTQGSATLSYDGNGNLTGDGAHTYGWNMRNQLASIGGSGLAASFAYDALGRRRTRTVDGQARNFVSDRWNTVAELGGAHPVLTLSGRAPDETFARTTDGTTRSVLTDALGTPVAVADAAGAIVDQFATGPFGEGDGASAAALTGREVDGTGLLYFRNRYYSPALQGFISEDPLRIGGGGMNFYAYGGGDPINTRDPLGLSFINDVAGTIDTVVPDAASEVAAGALDGMFAGLPSAAMGIPAGCWGSAHNMGQFLGAAAGATYTGGLVAGSLAAGGVGTIAAGAAGGAFAGAHQAVGMNPGASASDIAGGAITGVAGGLGGGVLAAAAGSGGAGAAGVAAAGGVAVSVSIDAGGAAATGGSYGPTVSGSGC